jgi:DNA gyrase subunit A
MAEDKTPKDLNPIDRTGMANPGDDFDRIETVDLQVECDVSYRRSRTA